ncbi:MAG: uroporphyrinogen decarboxylase family protein [Acutalibacteraceae bacterium]|jgi:uroporphyrinogen decarboxylase
MTHKERAFAALDRQIPDRVPTFELEFQLSEEMFGLPLVPEELRRENIGKLSAKEKDAKLFETAQTAAYIYGELDYSIIPLKVSATGTNWEGNLPAEYFTYIKYLQELTNNNVALGGYGDGTFAIPDGDKMYEFAYRTVDDPDGLHAEAKVMADSAIERNKRLAAAGVEVIFLCADYCYNSGPFLSPAMFSEFIQPYLYRIIDEGRKNGQYMIKHTDGNIMPIIDQLVDCKPHALHSLDPMAGVDIKEVKEKYGDKVALCGNVHCAALQTGTDEEVIQSAEYCLTYGKPNGGYLFCTSNVPFKGMPPERYRLILDVWKRMRDY